MHPYVYKKHHTPYQLLAVVILSYIMILSQPVSSLCPNYPVQKIKIHSELSKGYVRIEGGKVVASKCNHCPSVLYKVTIEERYMLLYHIQSGKFICWNRSFKRLVARRNPVNLTYCKFGDDVSKIPAHKKYKIRYTSRDENNREVEIRFNKSGAFARPKLIEKCVRNSRLHEDLHCEVKEFLKLVLDPARIRENTKEMEAYQLLVSKCANPDFLVDLVGKCTSGQTDFCRRMKEIKTIGHNISPEIRDLCKIE